MTSVCCIIIIFYIITAFSRFYTCIILLLLIIYNNSLTSRALFTKFLYNIILCTADAALVFEQNSLTVMEATPVQVATVCVAINELPAGGLGLDIEVPIMAQNGTAGAV